MLLCLQEYPGWLQTMRGEEKVSETVILGHGSEAAPAVVELLKELGLMS